MRTRSKLKLTAAVLALVLVTVGICGQTVFASDANQKANTLKSLGLFLGTGTGYELEKQVTRAQAAVMLVRLLGMEKEAQNGNYSHPFTDVPGWADKYVAYMYDGGLTRGVSNELFDPNGLSNLQMYSTFALRALSYEDGVDFTYRTAEQKAHQLGLVETFTDSFLRGDMVAVSYFALGARLKNSDNTLLDKLVADSAVDAESAQPVQRLFATETGKVTGDNNADDKANSQAPTNGNVDNTRIKLSIGNEEFIVNIYDNPTSRDFLSRLPLTLVFEDFSGFEKMSVLEEGLTTEGAPEGTTPSVGDFAYYAPWKDITIFYGDWHYSHGLIQLGKIDSGVEELVVKLESLSDNFTMTIERID